MFLLLRLGMRNLFRQKRRNFLLGIAMAIGVMLLVMANSFSNGLTDIMMNKILRWVTGHVSISVYERGRMMCQVFRDKEVLDFVFKDYKDMATDCDEAIGTFVRAIGNGKSDNIILIGVDVSKDISDKSRKEIEESFRVIEGSWDDLNDTKYENPVIISQDKLKYLNIKRGDILRLRFRNMFGQDQAARVTVVGTMKTENIFMGPVTFGNLKNVKAILGYDEHSIGALSLNLKNPEKDARKVADAIHARLKSKIKLAVIPGIAAVGGTRQAVTVLGYKSDPKQAVLLEKQLEMINGKLEDARLHKQALLAAPLAKKMGVTIGSNLEIQYQDKWGKPSSFTIKVGGFFKATPQWDPNLILLQDERFYEAFYSHWPQPANLVPNTFVPKTDHPAYAQLSPEWILLPRTYTTEELEKKMKDMGKSKYRATVVDVGTMYETAQQAIQLQGVLSLITFSAVLVLFFIILIGVVNTLRMTIRERTREIGTIRAIGMQRFDVRSLFIIETLLLALFAGLTGILMAFLVMAGISAIPMHMEDNPMGMFLVSSRFYFIPTWFGVISNLLIILVLSGVTAYFPARRAANLSPGAALRHIE